MRNRKQNGANIKNTPKMPLRSHKTINQEGNNTLSTSNLQKSQWKINEKWNENEKSLMDTIRKTVKEEFKEHEPKMSEMISNNLHNTNDCLD